MAKLDPTGDWERRGARALDNPGSVIGESSLERLHSLLGDLEQLDGKLALITGPAGGVGECNSKLFAEQYCTHPRLIGQVLCPF
ncbi:hypothetical protein CTI12_AA406380 [Artemisia annua]|uniref:DUF8018 domain-containing protein n=1 Tax=Artemisia annua TaxID=35608 RepID=A0A2U1M6U6_ARTAN|nr:hypothetical protein CTI12_AA406380 [Artemisia annua]